MPAASWPTLFTILGIRAFEFEFDYSIASREEGSAAAAAVFAGVMR